MSAEFQKLLRSVAELKTDLMDFPPSPTVPYSNSNLLKCRAFVVFSHAEMQVYWEAVARRILLEAEGRWKSTTTMDRVIATLVAFRRPDRVFVPQDPVNPPEGGDFGKIIQEAVNAQNMKIGENNGIKRANIADLLIPLGVLPGDFVEAMLIQLDQTGSRRGVMVHKSSQVSLRTIRDPFADEVKSIDDLVTEIDAFDSKLESLGLLSMPAAAPLTGPTTVQSPGPKGAP